MFRRYQVPVTDYQTALRQVVTGCSLGGPLTLSSIETVKDQIAEYQKHPKNNGRAIKIMAISIYRDMVRSGYSNYQIVAMATEIIDQVSENMKKKREEG